MLTRISANLISLAGTIYLGGGLVYFAIFAWQDIKTNGLFVSPHQMTLDTPLARAVIWPYFAIKGMPHNTSSSGITPRETPDEKNSVSRSKSAAVTRFRQGKYTEAENAFRELLAMRERAKGAEHPATLASRNNLACVLTDQGRHAEAVKENRAVLVIRERVLGSEHPDTLDSRQNLATALQEQSEYAEAEKEFRILLAIRERILGTEHLDVTHCCYSLALCLVSQRKLEESLEFARRAENGLKKAGHPHAEQLQQVRESIEAALAK